MSKQRFLGGLLGANPLRAGSFTDTAITGTIVDAQGIFLGGATGNFTVTGDDIVHNVTSQFDILFADLTGYTGKYYCEAYIYGPHGRAGTLTSSISSFTGNTYGILGSQSGHVGITAGSTYSVLVDGTSNSVMSATLDGTQYHLVVGFAFDFDNDELTISLTDPFIDGTQTWVTSAFGTSTTFPASATITRAGVTDRLAVGEFSTVYDGVIFNFGDNPTFSGNLPTGCSTDSSEWCRDAPTAYDGKFGITVGSTDRTTANVGILSLDEAGPEANGSNELTQLNWGGIRGRDVLTDTAAVAGDANWNDVVLLLDGSSTADLSSASPTVTPSASGLTSGNSGGKYGQYIDLQNSGYITVGLASNIGVSGAAFTVETWAYFDNQADEGIFNLTTTGGFDYAANSISIGTNATNWNIYHDGGSSQQVSPGPSNATWYHVAVVFDGTDLVYYVDGSAILTKSNHAANIPAAGYSTVMIGGYYSASYVMDGRIEDFRVTKGVARDIAADWAAGVYNSALPQGAATAASTSLANTGILSLSELLQVSYGTAAAWDGTGVELLLVAGGGGAGGVVTGSANIGGGGGGAGAYYPLSNQTFALNTSYTFTVGAGGAGNTGAGQGSSGGATTLVGGSFNLSSPGGGGGGAFGSAASNGASGGSGGGAGWNSTGGSSTAGAGQFGNAGGSTSGLSKAGGGGGAGSAGAISGSNYDGADGGSGKTWAIDGVALAGGGGAGGWQGQGTGYIGQGQDGGANGSGGTATANTGGGGGGGRRAATEAGTDGATGVIKVWVPQAGYSGYTAGTPANVTASAVTYSGTAGTLLTVTGTTTITFS